MRFQKQWNDSIRVGAAIKGAMQADPELATLFGGGSSEFETATARLDAYGTNVCGLSS